MHDAAPEVLYVARPAPWFRAVSLGFGALLVAGLTALTVASTASDDGAPAIRLAMCTMSASSAIAIAVLVALLTQRLRFTVTTAGVVLRSFVRTHRIGWPQIAVVAVDTGWSQRGQTLLAPHDGRRLGSPITEARSAMRRGERTRDHGPDLMTPARPTRAAIDAHVRFLRGHRGR